MKIVYFLPGIITIVPFISFALFYVDSIREFREPPTFAWAGDLWDACVLPVSLSRW